MEESKAAAYYDELTRKGEGAARFKQGLGFTSQSSTNDSSAVPVKGSSTSSFLSNFVKSSAPNTTSELQHQSELHNIKNKLTKKQPRVSDRDSKESTYRDRDRDREKHSRRRSRSRSRSRERSSRHRYRSSSRDGERRRGRRRSKSRSLSPRERRRERSGGGGSGGGDRDKGRGESEKERNGKIDYSRLIEGYDRMSPAERVKAKMKLQLTETVEKDVTKGMGSGWERFEFNKDAPLDDEEIEAAEDDAKLVKHIGQSFRFSAVEARKEEEIKDAHDKAMFGVPTAPISITTNHKVEEENNNTESNKSDVTSLVSEKVLAKQQGSWRDRVRKV